MSDVLIRDVPEEVVSAIDARSAELGLSRNEYLRRRLRQDRGKVPDQLTSATCRSSRRCSPTWLIRRSWPRRGRDLRVSGVDSVADRQVGPCSSGKKHPRGGMGGTDRTWPGANHHCHAVGDGVLRSLGERPADRLEQPADLVDGSRVPDPDRRRPCCSGARVARRSRSAPCALDPRHPHRRHRRTLRTHRSPPRQGLRDHRRDHPPTP